MDNNWNLKTLGTGPPGAMNILPVSTPTNDANEGLQRQESITLPRKLSQQTIDELWKFITEDEHTNNDGGSTNIPQIQKQPTLGDTTLEEFLTGAGAMGNNNSGGHIHDPSSISGNPTTNLSVEFQQKPMAYNVLNNIVPKSNNHGSYLHPNVNGSTSTYQPRQQQHLDYGYGYGTQLAFTSGQLNAHGIRDNSMGTRDQSHQENNVTLVQGVAPVPGGSRRVETCSPVTPFPVLDGILKINDGSSLVSPFPYTLSGSNSMRDRQMDNGIPTEKKVVEKTQRRKIRNRESAVRSQARKHTRIMELEAEAEKLRKENHKLLKKQAELSEMQTKLRKGMINRSRKQLRRTKSDIQ